MARAETYGDIARLEQLLDEYANIAGDGPGQAAGDPRRDLAADARRRDAPRPRRSDERPDDEEFDDFVLHVDGWLCEIKDAQIRDGLHILGAAPEGEARVNLVLAILRAAQVWGGRRPRRARRCGRALGLKEACADGRRPAARRWRSTRSRPRPAELGRADGGGRAGTRPARRTCTTTPDVELVLRPSPPPRSCPGWPHHRRARRRPARARRRLRARRAVGLAAARAGQRAADRAATSTPSTRAPSRRGWPGDVGQAMADSLVALPRRDRRLPASVGPVRLGHQRDAHPGDDIAEVLALLGVRPVWDEASRRVSGLEVIPLDELGRPRIDVTVRISGFFRDAFPHVVAMLDDAVAWSPTSTSRTTTTTSAPTPEPTSPSTATSAARRPRIFGSKPGPYGAGILQVVESGTGATTATSPRSTRRGAATPTAAASTAPRPPTTCAPTTAGSRSPPRTSTPASTTSPTPTTTSSTTAAWSPPSAR